MAALIPGFFVTALLYAMVGFGGGSTYNALLVLAQTDYQVLPTIALSCNIIVVSGGIWHFARAGLVSVPRLLPFACLSVPMAWLGGRIVLAEETFVGILAIALLFTSLSMLLGSHDKVKTIKPGSNARNWAIGLPLGAGIGLLAGIAGVGGGIFLAPVLHWIHWGSARAIAAAASVFILVNSIAGLAGQLMKLGELQRLDSLEQYYWLAPAVLIGGQIGSRIGSRSLHAKSIRMLTGVLVGFVTLRLLRQSL